MTSLSLSHIFVGAIIQSTLDEAKAKTHSAALSELTAKASHVVGLLDQNDELTFLRIRSKQREIMVGLIHRGEIQCCYFFAILTYLLL